MKPLRWIAVMTGVVALAITLSACGTEESKTAGTSAGTTGGPPADGGVEAARKLIEEVSRPPAWSGPTEKVDISKAKGKKVFFVNLVEAIPALHQWGAVMRAELEGAGVKTQLCDGKGSPNSINSCLQKAITARPDALVTLALDTKFIAAQLADAKAAGIPVVTAQTGRPVLPTEPPGRTAEVSFDYVRVGEILAAKYAVDTNCEGAPPQIVTTTSSREPSEAEVEGIQTALKRFCPDQQQRKVENVLIPDWATKLPTLTRSMLLRDPDLTYLLPLYDGMTLYMSPAVRQLGRKDVKIASFNATPVVMVNQLAKDDPLVADVGGPNDWFGAALADQTLRLITGVQPVEDEGVPLRLFTRDNIGDIDLTKEESTWYGDAQPICEYRKLWGLAC